MMHLDPDHTLSSPPPAKSRMEFFCLFFVSVGPTLGTSDCKMTIIFAFALQARAPIPPNSMLMEQMWGKLRRCGMKISFFENCIKTRLCFNIEIWGWVVWLLDAIPWC